MSYRTRWTILMTIGGLAATGVVWAITDNIWRTVVGPTGLRNRVQHHLQLRQAQPSIVGRHPTVTGVLARRGEPGNSFYGAGLPARPRQ